MFGCPAMRNLLIFTCREIFYHGKYNQMFKFSKRTFVLDTKTVTASGKIINGLLLLVQVGELKQVVQIYCSMTLESGYEITRTTEFRKHTTI